MAIVLVNKDGTSNAKAGDYVVTGGGVYYKNPVTGNTDRVSGLDTSTGSSGNFNDVISKFNSLINNSSSNSSSSSSNTSTNTSAGSVVSNTGSKGVVELAPDPLFNPNEYMTGGNTYYGTASGTTNSTATSGLNKIIGYAVVGLVGIALLDKFMNSKGR